MPRILIRPSWQTANIGATMDELALNFPSQHNNNPKRQKN
jgi:hypothetical protein